MLTQCEERVKLAQHNGGKIQLGQREQTRDKY